MSITETDTHTHLEQARLRSCEISHFARCHWQHKVPHTPQNARILQVPGPAQSKACLPCRLQVVLAVHHTTLHKRQP